MDGTLRSWADSKAEARCAAAVRLTNDDPKFAALKPTLTITPWAESHRN
jgi:hypothetical protein